MVLYLYFHLITQAPLDMCLVDPGIMYGLSVLEILCGIRTEKLVHGCTPVSKPFLLHILNVSKCLVHLANIILLLY